MNIEEIIKQVLEIKGSAFFYTPSIYKNSKSFFFKSPAKIFTSSNCSSLNTSIDKFYNLITNNCWGYCLLDYEAGYCFEKKLKRYLRKNDKEIFTGFLFNAKDIITIDSKKIKISPIGKNFNISSFKLNTTKKKYISDIKKIKTYIEEGDTYQVNYTIKGRFKFKGDPINLFKNLLFNQSAKYSAFINLGDKIIISLSPELFFQQNGQKIKTSPMKGTIKRGTNILEDELQKYKLEKSEKDRAENLMIVDLLRNDIGKISEYGSVKVNSLFTIEKYESLYQMISNIEAKLNKNGSFPEILKNIFPCGSITGAPKIRTMEIIKELETERRGIYTGAIGIVKKNKSIFNVSIRTIEIDEDGQGSIGLGSGIVWDSDPEKEYEETLLKSRFLTNSLNEFMLFETMKYENGEICHLNEHLERLRRSAEYFLFFYNERIIKSKLTSIIDKLNVKKRIKLILNKWGKINIIVSDYPNMLAEIKIIVSEKKVSSGNLFQYFKTDSRALYNEEFEEWAAEGFFDVVFLNKKGQLTEGAISNIFIKQSDRWLTPSASCGLLPGIERKHWLSEDTNVMEDILHLEDLLNCEEIVLTNSLRGRTKVGKIYFNKNEFKEF